MPPKLLCQGHLASWSTGHPFIDLRTVKALSMPKLATLATASLQLVIMMDTARPALALPHVCAQPVNASNTNAIKLFRFCACIHWYYYILDNTETDSTSATALR